MVIYIERYKGDCYQKSALINSLQPMYVYIRYDKNRELVIFVNQKHYTYIISNSVLWKKAAILCSNKESLLNKRHEIFSKCIHRKYHLLSKVRNVAVQNYFLFLVFF